MRARLRAYVCASDCDSCAGLRVRACAERYELSPLARACVERHSSGCTARACARARERACLRVSGCVYVCACVIVCRTAARAHACACLRIGYIRPYTRTACVHPHLCARARACVLMCVRACVCAAAGVVHAQLRVAAQVCVHVPLRDRIGVRVEPHADLYIDARGVYMRASRVCPSVRPELRCIDPVPAGHGRRPQWRRAGAPAIGLRVNVGAVRQQRRHRRRVPFASGPMERRLPAADRARAHTTARVDTQTKCTIA